MVLRPRKDAENYIFARHRIIFLLHVYFYTITIWRYNIRCRRSVRYYIETQKCQQRLFRHTNIRDGSRTGLFRGPRDSQFNGPFPPNYSNGREMSFPIKTIKTRNKNPFTANLHSPKLINEQFVLTVMYEYCTECRTTVYVSQ